MDERQADDGRVVQMRKPLYQEEWFGTSGRALDCPSVTESE
jgi:hypothetical protein